MVVPNKFENVKIYNICQIFNSKEKLDYILSSN